MPKPCAHSTSICVHSLFVVQAFAMTWGLVCTFCYLFLAYLILLGILDPFHLLGHPRFIPILHSHRFLLNLLGFPSLNYHILYFRVYGLFHQSFIYLILYFGLLWPILACFLFLIMFMGLPLISLGSFGPTCFLWDPFAIFFKAYGSLFLPFGLDGFLLNLLTLFLPYC